MRANSASGQFHELVPVISRLLCAARPIFLKIVEDCFANVVITGWVAIFLKDETFRYTTFVCAHVFLSILRHHWFFILLLRCGRLLFFSFLLFLFFIKIVCCFKFCNTFLLQCVWCVIDSLTSPKSLLGASLSKSSVIRMLAHAASFDLFELFPFVYNFIAADPSFLYIVENRLSRVKIALGSIILWFKI